MDLLSEGGVFMKHSVLSFAIFALAGTSLAAGQDAKMNGKLNPTDAQFVRDAMASGHHEIEMAQVALKRSNDPQVKSLAQRLVNDHTAAGNKLEDIAKANGLLTATPATETRREDIRSDEKQSAENHGTDNHGTTTPAAPATSSDQTAKKGNAVPATTTDLQTDIKNRNAIPTTAADTHTDLLQGAEFDKAWAKQMVQDHKDAISKFEMEEKQAQNSELRSFVSMTLPTLREHLAQAQALDK